MSAWSTSGIVQSVNVLSAASTDAVSSGSFWPSRPANSTATVDAPTRSVASRLATVDGSMAYTFSTAGG